MFSLIERIHEMNWFVFASTWPRHQRRFIAETQLRQRKAAINPSPWKPIKYLKTGPPISGKALHGVGFTEAYKRPLNSSIWVDYLWRQTFPFAFLDFLFPDIVVTVQDGGSYWCTWVQSGPKTAVFASCMLINLHACSDICDASTVMLMGTGSQRGHTWLFSTIFSSTSRFKSAVTFCLHFLGSTQLGVFRGGLEPADDACCMGTNRHPPPPRGDSASAADAFNDTTFFWQLFFLPSLQKHF